LFICLTGELPFEDNEAAKIGNAKMGMLAAVSQGARDVVSGLLTVDLRTRTSVEELAKHPWLN
jgi:hypothetical protein